jgi:hypothetical protein
MKTKRKSDANAERIAALEKTVQALTARLERLQRCFPAAMLRDLEILAGEKR